jgi:DNA-binding response OmpR family regulator
MKSLFRSRKPKMNAFEREKTVVLALDDDPAIVADLTQALSTAGYGCHTSPTLTSAVEQYCRLRPDLVIADLHLAGPDGRLLVAALRREIGYVDVPMMFLSSIQVPDIIRRNSLEARGAYYLRKPFDSQVLLELIDKALWTSRVAVSSS